jgi:hypothetical protein
VSNFNRDGAEANNALSLSVDTRAPGLVISGFPSLSRLSGDSGSTAQVYPLTLTFSEDPGTSFVKADLVVTGGPMRASISLAIERSPPGPEPTSFKNQF